MIRSSTLSLLGLSFFIQLILLLYAEHVDSHPEAYGGLKYTDVDWRVISDGARHIFSAAPGERASGWLVQATGWNIGE
jgi:phosphatidylinositol glycan class M